MFNNDIAIKIKNLEIFYQKLFLNKIDLKQIFSWNELEYLLNLRPFLNHKRFRIISNKNYKWDACGWLTDENTYPSSLIQEEMKSYLCYITDCSRASKGINSIAKSIEDFTNASVDAHLFFSLTSNKHGFGIHSDLSHNFIVQIEGETNFKVWNIKDIDNKRHIDNLEQTPYLDVIMKPGDCIFIPAYYWHVAESYTKRLSVSFPITTQQETIKEDRHWIKLNV